MKKILGLAVAAMLVMAMVGAGTWAFFSDTETATGNILTAGTMDLTINNANAPVTMFTLIDAKPGDNIVSAPVFVALKNVGSLAGDLSISATVTETESTGTTGTAQSGTLSTMTDTVRAEANGYWVGHTLTFTGSSVNTGQSRLVTASTSAGLITVASDFSTGPIAAADTYSLHTEQEVDGDPGELGGYVLVSVWVDVNDSGSTYEDGTDVQLLPSSVTSTAAPLLYNTMASMASTWPDVVTPLALGGVVDVYVAYDFPTGGNPNDAQGDSVSFELTFTLDQQP